jgi:hypothetical protein
VLALKRRRQAARVDLIGMVLEGSGRIHQLSRKVVARP